MEVFIYSIVGALFFKSVEGWAFSESFYFVMMTFTTVGFGDYHVTRTPQVNESCTTNSKCESHGYSHGNYLFMTMIYILCGLILTGSTFNFLIIHCMVPKKEEITVNIYQTQTILV